MEVAINYLILGNAVDQVFTVKLPKTDNVSLLKDAIKKDQAPDIDHTPASNLELWKVNISFNDHQALANFDCNSSPKLCPLKQLSMFQDGRHDCIHVIVKVPPNLRKAPAIDPSQLLPLNCLVHGDHPNRMFTVEIPKTDNVSILRKLIKEAKRVYFNNTCVSDINIWKVSQPSQQGVNIHHDMLSPWKIVGEIFKDISDQELHVIVNVTRRSEASEDKEGASSLPPSTYRLISDVVHPLVKQRENAHKERQRGPPSTLGKPDEFDKMQDDSVTYLACVRPPKRESHLPLTLLDAVFAKFVEDCRTVKPTAEAYECVRQLRERMNNFYSNEVKRGHALREILTIGGINIEVGPIASSRFTTDGHALCGSHPIIILGLKDEISSSGAEPSLQALLCYDTFIQEYRLWTDPYSIHSCFVITLAGPRVAFAGCALTERSIMETFSSVAIDFHYSNREAYATLARHLTALKTALDTLSDRYFRSGHRKISNPPDAAARSISRIYPYPTTATRPDTDEPLSFTYDAELENMTFLFKGQTNDRQPICIKFVHHYGKDVHIWCAEQGFAPKLIGFEVLPGGWSIVVMEFLDESWVPLSDIPNHRHRFKETIHTAIVKMHQQSMVHGDIRNVNIMVKKNDEATFMLIDYDWAGLVNQVKYPEFINTDPVLQRPSEVRYDVPIVPDHDLYMLETIF